jgi:heme/copper-type cytochrome/quinol oxidase subunit 3
MGLQKISFMPYPLRYLLVLFILAGSFIFSASHLAYAHTFSSSESAEFLSLVDQIRAETALVTVNLENNSATLAQAHAEKASDRKSVV